LEADKANGNNLWRESINKELEMINQFETFRRLDKGEQLPSDFKPVPYFIVFANKFEGPMETGLLSKTKMCILASWVWRLSDLVSS
jgi:hypothetical protein